MATCRAMMGAMIMLAACNADGGTDDHTSSDLAASTESFVRATCACEPSSMRPQCRSNLQTLMLSDCELDALMRHAKEAQADINCFTAAFEQATRCVTSADCAQDQIAACGDLLFEELEPCPTNGELERALDACEP